MTRILNIAVAQYPLDFLASEQAYHDKITHWVERAVDGGANLLVFPEYGAMELASLAGHEAAAELHQSIDAVSDRLSLQSNVHRGLAQQRGLFILAGSAPWRDPHSDRVTNIARIFSPSGQIGEYHKIIPTPWERDAWDISPGPKDGLQVFDIGIAKIGLVICYDIEFPLISRALAEAGAEVILAPSNTETEHGYFRVRTGCMARALENQIYTVHSPTVGPAPWCPAVDQNTGKAGVFAPSDTGFPPGGVVSEGTMNMPDLIFAQLDLALLASLRHSGRVRTYRDWDMQPGTNPLPKARLTRLT